MAEEPEDMGKLGLAEQKECAPSFALLDILEHFLAMYRSQNTRRNYETGIRKFLNHANLLEANYAALLAIPFPEIHKMILRFLRDEEKIAPDGHLANPNTVNAQGNRLIAFFRFLTDIYQYPFNPARAVPLPEKTRESQTPILTQEELFETIAYMRSHHQEGERQFRDYLIILALFHFALRRHELASLRWDQLKQAPQWHFCIQQKGNRWKYLPVPSGFMALLNEFADRHGRSNPFIFHPIRNNKTKTLEKSLSPNAIYDLVKRVNLAVLPGRNISPHSFRGTFLTLARKHNLDTKSIMNATGQATERMVNYYDVREKLEANAVNFFADWF